MSDTVSIPPTAGFQMSTATKLPTKTPVEQDVADLLRDIEAAAEVAPSSPAVQSSVNVDQVLAQFLDRQRNSPIAWSTPAWNRLQSELVWLRHQLAGA